MDLGDHGRMKAAVLSAVVEEPREESGPVTPLALSMEEQTVWVSLLNEKLAILGHVSIFTQTSCCYLYRSHLKQFVKKKARVFY